MLLTEQTKAVVTGGASGMGESIARHLSAKGVSVVILDRDEGKATAVAESIGGLAIACDVTSKESVEEAFNTIDNTPGDLRVAVMCAGVAPAKRVVGREGPMALEDFANVININLIGTFNVLRLASHRMSLLEPVGEERGVVINTASVAAYEGQIGQAAYSASKGGVVSMTLPTAREFAKLAIRVNTIAPGLIETPMLLAMPQDVQDSLGAQVPFPNRLGKPDEFASLCMHVIDNSMINGEVIRLDGAIRMTAK